MAFPSLSFAVGLLVILYLLSFVLFAIVRIATGVSIQRVGYFSLRRIAYTPRDGIRIEIRGLGLALHRPTFARPTWLSIRLTDLKVTFDPTTVSGSNGSVSDQKEDSTREASSAEGDASTERNTNRQLGDDPDRSKTWKRLTQLKERIKALHGKIRWLRMIDIEVLNWSLVIANIATLQLGSLTVAVDTRRRTVDRGRLFRHKKVEESDQRPAEWIFVLKGVLFTAEGKESLEVLDICSLNVHGFLVREKAGLRDASISLKLGRVHVPYDDIMHCRDHIHKIRGGVWSEPTTPHKRNVSLSDLMEELDDPGSREEQIVQTLTESREFISSILRGIQEIQLAISFIGMSKKISQVRPSGRPMFLHSAMNEFGIDLFRLDPKSPAHRMYFSRDDIAHQALLAAISISVSIDDGVSKPERILYLPMVTTTIRTTLPSKTLSGIADVDVSERNANVLFANLVVTSPSVDVDLKHMPIVLALLRQNGDQDVRLTSSKARRQRLMSRLWPKASIKFSVQEPVARVVLPLAKQKAEQDDDFDLLISSISSISLDVESSHSSSPDVQYAFTFNFRVASQQLYYQSASGERHVLLENDALELRSQVSATTELAVVLSVNVDTLSMRLVRPEISKGLRQIVKQFNPRPHRRMPAKSSESSEFFVRRLPSWLVLAQLQGNNIGFEVAGVDSGISPDTRGLAFQLESWSVDYRHQRNASFSKHKHLHRRLSKSVKDDALPQPPPVRRGKKHGHTDDRKMQVHIQNLQGFIVEGIDKWEGHPFISLPEADIAMSTASDSPGPTSHINVHVNAFLAQYSLYRYYAFGVARNVFRRAFAMDVTPRSPDDQGEQQIPSPVAMGEEQTAEAMNVDIKLDFLQVKGRMPADPSLLVQVYSSELGRHRWSTPFLRSKVVRLCAEAPGIKKAWARVLSFKNLRADLRDSRRRTGGEYVKDRLIDVSSELARLAVPHQLVVHRIFDNIVNAFKATQQLQHRFDYGNDDYVLKKEPEGPKRLPKVSFRARTLMLELEDSPFEWKLGLIYRVGLSEQKQRLAREAAYRLKLKRLDEETQVRRASQLRNSGRSQTHRSKARFSNDEPLVRHSSTFDSRSRRRSSSQSENRGRQMRYNADDPNGLTNSAKIPREDAWLKLQEHNAASWRRRITTAMKYHRDTTSDIRSMFMGTEDVPHHEQDKEVMVEMPNRPGLMSAFISDLHIILDKPSFALADLPKFLHSVGKGMPADMKYSLLVPMNLQVNMGEARVSLRNYPLPILHVPALRAGQSSRLPSWSLRTDFVVAEEYRDEESMRQVVVEVIPEDKFLQPPADKRGFFVDVRRTVSPVKTYSDVDVSINTSDATSITWGTSYQPAIQDMMQVMENFTKPQLDPSERVGFWDKIRLIFHSRIRVTWRGDGDVHFKLKGSRDPYLVTGHGAGFVMCFRQNVRWDINQDNDHKRFMTVTCGEYVLAIPDYSSQARAIGRSDDGNASERSSSQQTQRNNAQFQKVIMKLSGDVRWLAGLVFEREVNLTSRSIEFKPHYGVTLKTPRYAKPTDDLVYDAFRGFRSHHIHLSIAVIAPVDRDWSVTNSTPSSSYNSIHLSPRFFTHFFDWWSLFSGVMALPIRQGKLFPGLEKSNKKFSRHLATIKYNLLLSPFYIAHIYKHKDIEDYSEDSVGATGLKLRIDSFMLDLHQRREEFSSRGKDNFKSVKTSGMRINQAQLDFITADMRAVSADIAGTSLKDLKRATDADIASYQFQNAVTPDLSRFEIPDNDFMWIDMDDFVEMDWILPAETHPEVRIMPLAFAPRFTYFRQTDHDGMIHGDPGRTSRFGDEPTHFCIMTKDNDPHRVQFDLVKDRLKVLDGQLELHKKLLLEVEAKLAKKGEADVQTENEISSLKEQIHATEDRKRFMLSMLKSLSMDHHNAAVPNESNGETSATFTENSAQQDWSEQPNLEAALSDFNNRFIIHNVQLKWNNGLRNIILRYVHQVSQRRGFVYYMSRRAVRFILDILQEQTKKRTDGVTPQSETATGQSSPQVPQESDKEPSLQERIENLLRDQRSTVDANDSHSSRPPAKFISTDLQEDVSDDFVAQNSYHVRLIAPQIQLQSEKNAKSVLLVTGKEMELKVIQIMDKARLADDVSGLVQRRFSLEMDGIQFFVTNSKTLQKFVHLYSANRYGAPKDTVWPPWLPLEVNFDFHVNPIGWFRVVQKTSASLRYDKYNTLRLKYHDEVSKGDKNQTAAADDAESRLDHVWVNFPQIRAICDSAQYYTMYVIVLDLLLYSEPLEKSRSERLEKIMLAADFSDLTGAPEMVVSLQERIRQLEEIKSYFQVHEKYLDRQGWQDRLSIESDLASCEDELFFIMKAITTSQQKVDDRTQKQTNGLLRWYLSASEIVWRLMRKNDEPLVEIQLQKAAYDRTDNSDGSNHNTMEIERIKGLNLLPDALYPEMIAPYFGHSQGYREESNAIKMFKVQWYMLEAIAGIPVLDQFEVNLFPLKLQLERETGKKLFEYIFPGNTDSGSASPFIVKNMMTVQEDESDEERSRFSVPSINAPTQPDSQASTRPGSIDLRLRPTFSLGDGPPSPVSPSSHRNRFGGSNSATSQRSRSRTSTGSASVSQTSLVSLHSSAQNTTREGISSSQHGPETLKSTSAANADKNRRFGMTRSSSKEDTSVKPSDDITEMMSRASSYMTLAYVKVPSVVLCLSYKGRGDRNLEDVHDFVFRMPALEYRNKTWSNLDLALRLKKDVIKALISHTGAIIGNKFSHHRPTKVQQSRLRELANSSSLLPNTNNLPNTLTRTVTSLHRSSTHGAIKFERGRSDIIKRPFSRSQSGPRGSAGHDTASPATNGSMPDSDSFSFSSERAVPSPAMNGRSASVDAQEDSTHETADEQPPGDGDSLQTPEKSLKSSIKQKLRRPFKALD